MSELIIPEQTSPFVLATYVILAVCKEWPDAQASADAVLRQYNDNFGVGLRASVLHVSKRYRGRGGDTDAMHEFLSEFQSQSPMGGAVAEAVRAPFVERWLKGYSVGDTVFGFALVVDLLKPITSTPEFVRAGGVGANPPKTRPTSRG